MSFWKGFAQGWMQVDDTIQRRKMFQEELGVKRTQTLLDLYSKRLGEEKTVDDYADSIAWIKSRVGTSTSETATNFLTNLQANPSLAPLIYKEVLAAEQKAAEAGRPFELQGDQLASVFNIVNVGGAEARQSFQDFGSGVLSQFGSGNMSFEEALTKMSGYPEAPVGALDVDMPELYYTPDFEDAKKMREILDIRLIDYTQNELTRLAKSDEDEDSKTFTEISEELEEFEKGTSTKLITRFGPVIMNELHSTESTAFFEGFEENPYLLHYRSAYKPPQEAIDALLADPSLIDEFISYYGAYNLPEELR